MTREEYNDAISEEYKRHKEKVKFIMQDYAIQNNLYKIGDITNKIL